MAAQGKEIDDGHFATSQAVEEVNYHHLSDSDSTPLHHHHEEEDVYVENEEEDMELLADFELKEATGTVYGAIANLTNTILGSGVLGMPYALATTGVLQGAFLIVIGGCCAAFGLHLLAECADWLRKGGGTEEMPLQKTRHSQVMMPDASYYSLCRRTYPSVTLLIDAAVAIKCYGVAISYLIVIGDLMPVVCASIWSLPNDAWMVRRNTWITIMMPIIVVLALFRRLNTLRYTSWLALATICYLVVLVVGYFFAYGGEYEVGPVRYWTWGLGTFEVLGIFVFAFTCHQNLFPIHNELKEPSQRRISAVIGTSVGACFVVYETVAVLGYLTFHQGIQSNIVNNYGTQWPVTVGRVCVTVVVTFSYPLQSYPCRASLDKIVGTLLSAFGRAPDSYSFPRYLLLTAFITYTTWAIASVVTGLDVVFALVGATGSTTICYILPGLFYEKMCRLRGDNWHVRRIAAVLLGVMGVCLMVVAVTFIIIGVFEEDTPIDDVVA